MWFVYLNVDRIWIVCLEVIQAFLASLYYWACGTFYDSSLAPTEKLWLRGSSTHISEHSLCSVPCVCIQVCVFRVRDVSFLWIIMCALKKIWIRTMWQEFVKLFVLAVNAFEDCVHANLISTTSAQLVCVTCVFCTWVCVHVHMWHYFSVQPHFSMCAWACLRETASVGVAWSLRGPLNESCGPNYLLDPSQVLSSSRLKPRAPVYHPQPVIFPS